MASRPYEKSFTLGNTSAQLDLGLSANEALQISGSKVTNTSASGLIFSTNLAGDGGAAATGNVLELDRAIGGKETLDSALVGMSVNPGGKIYAYASTASVVVLHISGMLTSLNPRTY